MTVALFVELLPVPPLPDGLLVSAPVTTSTFSATAATRDDTVAPAVMRMFVAPATHGAVHTSA